MGLVIRRFRRIQWVHDMSLRALTTLLILLFCWTWDGPPAYSLPRPCPNGPRASALYCKYFLYYRAGNPRIDSRIARALALEDGADVRSVAIIAGITKYPNADPPVLEAARNDIDHLKKFFTDQQFDEIIVL